MKNWMSVNIGELIGEIPWFDRLLSLISSILLFLFGLSNVMTLVHYGFEGVRTFWALSGILLLPVSILLFLDFLDIQISLVKNRVWFICFWVAFALRIITYFLCLFVETYFGKV